MTPRTRYAVELEPGEPGVWLAPWDGDPGRTLDRAAAATFATRTMARRALFAARSHRRFDSAVVVAVDVPR